MLCKRKDKDSMIIAVPSFNGEVFQHFGKTPEFTLFTVENNAVIRSEEHTSELQSPS